MSTTLKGLTCSVLLGAIFSSVSAHADPSDWMIRVRAIDVVPDASSSQISLIGGQVDHISTRLAPELDISYFFTPCIAAELILATARHHAVASDTVLGSVDLGKVTLLPPTLTLQYHFLLGSYLKPYVGAGINFTHFFDIDSGPVASSISYDNAFGPALQIGADLFVYDCWFLNADIKKVFIRTDATVEAGATLTTRVKIDPMIYGLGVGYRF